ncbi:hypothetical protein S7711_08275 [Stachybotrys chartarum IBT 7711]|uniref:Cytochrome P450 n=1 Tax=Stachybotrys chartarum (strain CBS 109288 / IBT 7711) TaxID=1280523 RepID=A0A084AQM6_STACB|nr:hypothetical protein S7711_08275 [Stachybotrys chartarum IBT 7711]
MNVTTQHYIQDPPITDLSPRLATVSVLAVAVHHFIFRKGEWHLQAPHIFAIWALSAPILFVAETLLSSSQSWRVLARNAVLTTSCFTIATLSSIAVYRLFFHRLSDFPGPALARVSKLWHTVQCQDSRNHLVLDKLHQQYGDFVRTGPNEITIFDPEGLQRLDGPGNKNTKSVFYDFLLPNVGVETIRDKAWHDERRRIWTKAFSTKTLPLYQQKMTDHAHNLVKIIGKYADEGKVVPFSSFAYWFSFDVMGLFALNKSFGMMHNGQWHEMITRLRGAIALLGPCSSVPWLGQIAFKFFKFHPTVQDWNIWSKWCQAQIEEQIQKNDESTCISSYLIAESIEKGTVEQDKPLLTGEAITAIIAGSDTVALTTIFLFYELASHPEHLERLRQELSGIDVDDCRELEKLPHLNGVINETMRLHPALPTAGYRDSPEEGVTIAGRYIPGNTTLVAPRYTIFRSERCYEKPNDFVPERWYCQPELIKDNRSFLPFAQGRYTCIGKALALSELRTITTLLVSNFDFSFKEGDDGSSVVRDARDHFTTCPGPLELVFLRRE